MRKIYALISVILMTAVLLTACQPTPDTPPVVSKNDGTLEDTIYEGAPKGYVYEAPETYSSTESFYDGKLNITLDNVDIIAQKGITYPVYEVTITDFDMEIVKRAAEILFGDAKMVAHDTRLTKSQILNNQILPLKQEIAEIENGTLDPTVDEDGNQRINDATGMPYTIEQELKSRRDLLEWLEEEYKNAPDNIEDKYKTLDDYQPRSTFDADVLLENGKRGRLTIDRNEVFMSKDYDNHYAESVMRPGQDKPDDCIVGEFIQEYDILPTLDISRSEESAKKFAKSIGLHDYSFYGMTKGGEKNDISGNIMPEDIIHNTVTSYGAMFMRTVGDSICIPDSGVCGEGKAKGQSQWLFPDDSTPRSYGSPFCYEKFSVWMDENNEVRAMRWVSPLKIERELQSSVQIIDFDKVVKSASDILRRQAVGEWASADSFQEWHKSYNINFTDFELGYAMIMEKNKDGYYLLIPVWAVSYDSYIEEYIDEDKSEFEVIEVQAYKNFVVNAIDGSVIDRGFGY